MGAWSIGNEMVYYLFTPLIIYAYNANKKIGNGILFLTILIGFYFAFISLRVDTSLATQWGIYINPFNNLFLYVIGISIYYNFKNLQLPRKLNFILLFTSITLFIFIPFKDHISIVTGFNRILYVIISVVIVFSFYKISIDKITLSGKVFEQFGIATYGVYLLHPIVLSYCILIAPSHRILMISSVFFFTISLALMSYYFFESKIMRIGKRILSI